MARQYAQIITAIWRNDDFTALPHDEQWMYLLLNTQPDISAAGVLTVAVTRWAGRAVSVNPAAVRRLLEKLADKRFIVIDWDTDELLIRSFIRWDHGYSNPKRQPAIRDAVDAVESRTILAVLSGELERVAMPERFRGRAIAASTTASTASTTASTTASNASNVTQVTSKSDAVLDAPTLHQKPEFSQVDSLSDGYRMAIDSHGHTDGSEERRVPLSPIPYPQPQESTPLVNAPRRPEAAAQPHLFGDADAVVAVRETPVKRVSRDQQFAEFWQAYPRRVGKQGARKMWDTKVRAGADPATIAAGALAFAANRKAWETPVDKIPHPQTWLNAGRWDDELSSPPAAAPVGGFDAKAARFVDMRDRLRSEGPLNLIRPTQSAITGGTDA